MSICGECGADHNAVDVWLCQRCYQQTCYGCAVRHLEKCHVDPAAVIRVAREIADEIITDHNPEDEYLCAFCGGSLAHPTSDQEICEHDADCLWLRLRAALGIK